MKKRNNDIELNKVILTIGLVIILALIFFFGIPRTTSTRDYIVSDREDRVKIVNELKKDCRSMDITPLIVTYKNKFHDSNASRCWSNFMKECFSAEAEKLNYKLKIVCPVY